MKLRQLVTSLEILFISQLSYDQGILRALYARLAHSWSKRATSFRPRVMA